MGRGTWSWIVPHGLWEIAKPLIPPSKVRPRGGGTQDTPDETLFAAITYVLVSGCAWRALPPCFGISKSTAHRRFLIWSRAVVWGRLHEVVLHQLDDAGLIDVTRVVLDTAHVRAKRGGELTGPSPVDRGKPGSKMQVLSDANGLPLLVGNTHDSEGLKPMVEVTKRDTTLIEAGTSSPNASTRTKLTIDLTCADGCDGSASACASPAKASSPVND
jgi:transposase